MCISKKTVKREPLPPVTNHKNIPNATIDSRQKVLQKQSEEQAKEAAKYKCTADEQTAIQDHLAAVETQLSQEPTVEPMQEEISPREPSHDYNKTKTNTGNENEPESANKKEKKKDKKKSKEVDKNKEKTKEKEKKTKKKEEGTGKKDSKKMALQGSSHSHMARSPVRNKKGIKGSKSGFPNADDLSINNDKTEFLENAQLTKLMSHADVKALMGGQMAQGADVDETSCRDTVEEVDSEMQDIAFSPLLAGIRPEEDKPFGALPNPQEQQQQKKTETGTT